MKVVATIDLGKVDKITDKAKTALLKTADALKTDLVQSQTMPFDTGELQNRSTFVDGSNVNMGSVRLVHDTPYARRLYFHPEYDFRKDKNPNAGGLWFAPYIEGEKKDFVKNAFVRFMK